MKSQPEIKVRRLAVFTGYGDADMGTAWNRRPLRAAGTPNRDGGLTVTPEAGDELREAVLSFAPVARAAQLQHAA